MGVLDRQTLRGEIRNRRLGRSRLAMRDRRKLPRKRAGERRRPDRGLSAPSSPRTTRNRYRRARRNLAEQLSAALHGLGRLLVFCVLAPLVLVRLLLRPKELISRIREAPTRLRAGAKRVRLESRDPDSVPGKVLETARISAWFVREELADMRDGIPTAVALKQDLSAGTRGLLDQLGEGLGLRATEDGETVGDRLFTAVAAGLVLGVMAIAGFVGTHNAVEELKTSETMALTSVTVVGLDRVPEAAALALLPAPGANLLELEVAGLGAPLRALPWVSEVSVTRDLASRTI